VVELNTSIARVQQLQADYRDDQLTLRAQARRPGVRHWWGRRSLHGQHGAYCYLCDEHISTWSSRWPITVQAQVRIELHRQEHIRGELDAAPLKEASET